MVGDRDRQNIYMQQLKYDKDRFLSWLERDVKQSYLFYFLFIFYFYFFKDTRESLGERPFNNIP